MNDTDLQVPHCLFGFSKIQSKDREESDYAVVQGF
jgi:hypothetical protein